MIKISFMIVGTAIGFAAGYYVGQKISEKDHEEEIAAYRRFYTRKYMDEDDGLDLGDENVVNYGKMVKVNGYIQATSDDALDEYEEYQDEEPDDEEYSDDETDDEEHFDECYNVENNVWAYQHQLIEDDEYYSDEDNSKVDSFFYREDGVFSEDDDSEIPMEEAKQLFGYAAINLISGTVRTVFVRNNLTNTDYVLYGLDKSYAKEVLAAMETPNEKKRRQRSRRAY